MSTVLHYMIFIPAYFAETTLKSVVARIPEPILSEVAAILIQDDASGDNTFEVAKQIAQENDKVVIARNIKNLGYGGTQKKSFRYALNKGYDAVVMIHGDGQLPPEFLPFILLPLRNREADIVLGSRMLSDPLKQGMPMYKYLGNRFLTSIMNKVLRAHFTDYHTGYVAVTLKSLKHIDFETLPCGHEISADLLIRAVRFGLRIQEVQIPTSYGNGSRSVSFKTSIQYGINVLRMLLYEQINKR